VQEMGCRVAVLTHRAELIRQDAKAIRAIWPQAPVGIYSAGLGRKEIDVITVAGIQSISRRPEKLGHIDVVIIDEAHLLSPTATAQYQATITKLRKRNPDMRLIGYTATPYRLGQGYLTEGEGALFTAVAYEVGVRRLIEQGWLANVVSSYVVAIDVRGVGLVAGEYNSKALEAVSDTDKINGIVADDVKRELAGGRTSAMVFGASVEHACRLRNEMRVRGLSCEVITGDTPREERDRIILAFKSRMLSVLVSVDVLTTGFDAPCTDLIADVRPTMSTSLYVQKIGRGMRICEGKIDCRVLDYGGNIDRHGPIDAVRVKPAGKGGGEAPIKTCKACLAQCAAGCRICPHCGAEFPAPITKVNDTASTKAVLSFNEPKAAPVREAVGSVEWARHTKHGDPDAPPTLRLDYYMPSSGGLSIPRKIASEWVCVEHEEGGFAWRKAMQWWASNVGCREPVDVADALSLLDDGYMAPVVAIETVREGKYLRVVKIHQGEAAAKDDDEEALEVPQAKTLLTADWIDDDLPF